MGEAYGFASRVMAYLLSGVWATMQLVCSLEGLYQWSGGVLESNTLVVTSPATNATLDQYRYVPLFCHYFSTLSASTFFWITSGLVEADSYATYLARKIRDMTEDCLSRPPVR